MDVEIEMMVVVLVGVGEVVVIWFGIGDIDVDEVVEMMINLFWFGFKGVLVDWFEIGY